MSVKNPHPAPTNLSPETLRYVRTCTTLESAQSQLKHASYSLSRKEEYALNGGERERLLAEAARENKAGWELRVRELSIAAEEPQPEPKAAPKKATAPKPEPKAVKPKAEPKPPCPHRAQIRGFVIAAVKAGLSMIEKDRRRGAVGMYLGRRIESCSELSAQEWVLCARGIREGILFW